MFQIPSKFPLGRLLLTGAVNDLVLNNSHFAGFLLSSLNRHAQGDWGDMSPGDKAENEFSLDKYLRILSAYEHPILPKIWIITEADRSTTTVLLPDEY